MFHTVVFSAAGGDLISWATGLFNDGTSMGVAAGKLVLIIGYVIAIVRAGSKIGAVLLGGSVVVLGWWFLNNATNSSVSDKVDKQVQGMHQIQPVPSDGGVNLAAGTVRL